MYDIDGYDITLKMMITKNRVQHSSMKTQRQKVTATQRYAHCRIYEEISNLLQLHLNEQDHHRTSERKMCTTSQQLKDRMMTSSNNMKTSQLTSYYYFGTSHYHDQEDKLVRLSSTMNKSICWIGTTSTLVIFSIICLFIICISALPTTYAFQFGSFLNMQALDEDSINVNIIDSDRFSLLERYVILMSRELKETQDRVKELENERPVTCTFNNTKYPDQATWKNACDTCKCQSGIVHCQPNSCLVLCDDAVIVPGKCCPVCFKRCKYNGSFYSHGNKVSSSTSSRICKCNDGHIQCEKGPSLPSIRMTLSNANPIDTGGATTIITAIRTNQTTHADADVT